jgi:tetratricopeptide (TPR) repeat protein
MQQRIVDAFREATPVSPLPRLCGLRAWQRESGDDSASYIWAESKHHIAQALEGASTDVVWQCVRRWMVVWPGVSPSFERGCSCDLATSVALVIGVARLEDFTQRAVSQQDWFSVSVMASGHIIVEVMMEGLAAATRHTRMAKWRQLLHLALQAADRMLDQPPVELTTVQHEHMQLTSRLALHYFYRTLPSFVPDGHDAEAFAAKIDSMVDTLSVCQITDHFTIEWRWNVQVEGSMAEGNVQVADPMALRMWQALMKDTIRVDDHSTLAWLITQINLRVSGTVCNVGSIPIMMRLPEWDWTQWDTPNFVLALMQRFYTDADSINLEDFDQLNLVSGLFMYPSYIPVVYRGDLKQTYQCMDLAKQWMSQYSVVTKPQLLKPGKTTADMVTRLRMAGAKHFYRRLARFDDHRYVMDLFSLTWKAASATLESWELPTQMFLREGDVDNPSEPAFLSVYIVKLETRLDWLMCVSRDDPDWPSDKELFEALPRPGAFTAHLKALARPCVVHTRMWLGNVALLAAEVCEKSGHLTKALEYTEEVLAFDPSDPKTDLRPTSHIEAHQIRGRVLASMGRVAEAEAAFESAVGVAQQHGLWLLEMLALADLQASPCEAGGAQRAQQRLEAVMGKMVAPRAMLTELIERLRTERESWPGGAASAHTAEEGIPPAAVAINTVAPSSHDDDLLLGFLRANRCEAYHAALQGLGAQMPQDLEDMEAAEWDGLGMKPLEKKRLVKALAAI